MPPLGGAWVGVVTSPSSRASSSGKNLEKAGVGGRVPCVGAAVGLAPQRAHDLGALLDGAVAGVAALPRVRRPRRGDGSGRRRELERTRASQRLGRFAQAS